MEKQNRVSASSALVLLVTVAALFASFSLVMGLELRVIHPFTAAAYGVCVLLTAVGLVRSFLCVRGTVQKWCMGIGLTLVTAFAALTVWSGYFSPLANAVLLPVSVFLSAVAIPVLCGRAGAFQKAWFYILVVVSVTVLLFVQLGVTHMLPETSDEGGSAVTETVENEGDAEQTPDASEDGAASDEAKEHKGIPVAFFVAWGLVLVLIVCLIIKYVWG